MNPFTSFMLHTINDRVSRYAVTPGKLRRIAAGSRERFLTFDDGYENAFINGKRVFAESGCKIIFFLVSGKIGGVNEWDKSGELAGKPLLNWDQIKELQSLGISFGSHSLTHADLTKLGDGELERETKESKRILEEKLGCAIDGFAYPFGYFNERVISAVRNAGYKWAVTTSDSIWEGWGNPYRMRRINISGVDPDWLITAKVSGLYDIKAVWELPQLIWDKIALSLRKA